MQIVTKITGDSLTAAEWNQVPDELENLITSSGQAPSAGDLFQVSKAVADYSVSGDYFLDTGAANSYVLGTSGARLAPTSYADGFSIRFRPANANTGASTVNVSGIGVVPITLADGSALPAGAMLAGDIVNINYNSVAARFELSTAEAQLVQPGVFRGCEIENDGGDADHDIVFNTGVAAAANLSKYLQLNTPLTKQIDSAWVAGDNAGGLFAGVVAPNTTYHCFLIENNVTKDIECGFDISVTASNIPIGYTNFSRIGSVMTDGAANIIQFKQHGNRFCLLSNILVINDNTFNTVVYVDLDVKVPTGIEVISMLNVNMRETTGDNVSVEYAQKDGGCQMQIGGSDRARLYFEVKTDNFGLISHRTPDVLDRPSSTYIIELLGWVDKRGRESY